MQNTVSSLMFLEFKDNGCAQITGSGGAWIEDKPN